MEDKDIKDRLKMIKNRDARVSEETKHANELLKLPFHLRIQDETQQQQFIEVYDAQLCAFERILKKELVGKRLPEDWKDDFTLFWTGYLKGEYKSINQFKKKGA